jgi:hypothetical protein
MRRSHSLTILLTTITACTPRELGDPPRPYGGYDAVSWTLFNGYLTEMGLARRCNSYSMEELNDCYRLIEGVAVILDENQRKSYGAECHDFKYDPNEGNARLAAVKSYLRSHAVDNNKYAGEMIVRALTESFPCT